MIRRLWQWFFFTALVCAFVLASLFLFEDLVADYYFVRLDSWRELCAAITPEQWQAQGNILLGLMWLFSGVVAYSMIIGLCCVILLVLVEKLYTGISGYYANKPGAAGQ